MELGGNLGNGANGGMGQEVTRELKKYLQNARIPRRSPRQLHHPGCAHPKSLHSKADERAANGEVVDFCTSL
jgi:hypothetical protein